MTNNERYEFRMKLYNQEVEKYETMGKSIFSKEFSMNVKTPYCDKCGEYIEDKQIDINQNSSGIYQYYCNNCGNYWEE